MTRVPPRPAEFFALRFPLRPRRLPLRAALALAFATGLAACAGSEGLPGLTPPQTHVPEVAATDFPSVGAAASAPHRARTLTPDQQKHLQSDLERLARQQAHQASETN